MALPLLRLGSSSPLRVVRAKQYRGIVLDIAVHSRQMIIVPDHLFVVIPLPDPAASALPSHLGRDLACRERAGGLERLDYARQ
jgi:hypothetical protein